MTVGVSLFLSFGEQRVEVLSGAGYDAVCEQAEKALSLHPQSFDFFDACGKVDSDSFDRVLAASKGFCVLELREKPEWQNMRAMEAQIQKLMERTSQEAQIRAEKDLEQRVLARVDTAVEKILKDRLDGEVVGRLASVETELAEQAIVASAANGHLEVGLAAARMELQNLRAFCGDQLAVVGSLDFGLERVAELACSVQAAEAEAAELRAKVDALEAEATEQTITASALNGHLECGLAAAQQELRTLRTTMSDQYSTLSSRVDQTAHASRVWSDGFKTHELGSAKFTKSALLKPRELSSKSLPQLQLRPTLI